MYSLGTFSVVIINDGNGVSFTAKPTSFGVISIIVFLMFPPYTLLAFLCIHALLSNTKVLEQFDPYFGSLFQRIKNGAIVFVDTTKDIIKEMRNGDDHSKSYSDVDNESNNATYGDDEDDQVDHENNGYITDDENDNDETKNKHNIIQLQPIEEVGNDDGHIGHVENVGHVEEDENVSHHYGVRNRQGNNQATGNTPDGSMLDTMFM